MSGTEIVGRVVSTKHVGMDKGVPRIAVEIDVETAIITMQTAPHSQVAFKIGNSEYAEGLCTITVSPKSEIVDIRRKS